MPAPVPPKPNFEPEFNKLADIFFRAQSTKNHHTLQLETYQIHKKLAEYTEPMERNKVKLSGEVFFKTQFIGNLAKAFELKKGQTPAERVISYVGGYVKVLNNKVQEARGDDEEDDEDEDDETFAERFCSAVVRFILGTINAANKDVRYQVVQTARHVANFLGPMQEELFRRFAAALWDRLDDKEPSVRSSAAEALCGLYDLERSRPDDHRALFEALSEQLSFDSSNDVRRAILKCLPPRHPLAIQAILSRSRDTDISVRKALYVEVLKPHTTHSVAKDVRVRGDLHPLSLGVDEREEILRNGLNDREPSVKQAAEDLLLTWAEVILLPEAEDADKNNVAVPRLANVIPFLHLFELSSGRDTEIANQALKVFLNKHAGQLEKHTFSKSTKDEWVKSSVEDCFLARAWVEFYRDRNDEGALGNIEPVAVDVVEAVVELYDRLSSEANSSTKEDRQAKIIQLMHLLSQLDQAYVTCRDKAQDLITRMLKDSNLSERLLEPCLQLQKVFSKEKPDFIIDVVDLVEQMREAFYDQFDLSEDYAEINGVAPTFWQRLKDSGTDSKRLADADEFELKCLNICNLMLEKLDEDLRMTRKSAAAMGRFFKTFIIPTVQDEHRKPRVAIQAIKCLGLCGLLSEDVPPRYLRLIKNRLCREGSADLRVLLCQILFDWSLRYGNSIFRDAADRASFDEFVSTRVREEREPDVQAAFCQGVAKMLHVGMFGGHAEAQLKNLFKTFISPYTQHNQRLRQFLAFFFPKYSHSSPRKQRHIQEIFDQVYLDAFTEQRARANSSNEDEEDDVPLGHIVDFFVQWTDPNWKECSADAEADEIQIDLARSMFYCLLVKKDSELTSPAKREICKNLSKLYFPDKVDALKIQRIILLINAIHDHRPLRDATNKSYLDKFHNMLKKKYEKALALLTDEDIEKLKKAEDLFRDLDDLIPLDGTTPNEDVKPSIGKRRWSEGLPSSRASSPGPSTRQTSRAKKRRSSPIVDVKSEPCSDIEFIDPTEEERANYHRGRSSTTDHSRSIKEEDWGSDIEIISVTLPPPPPSRTTDSAPPVKLELADPETSFVPPRLPGQVAPKPGSRPRPRPITKRSTARVPPPRPRSPEVIVISSDDESRAPGPSKPQRKSPQKPRVPNRPTVAKFFGVETNHSAFRRGIEGRPMSFGGAGHSTRVDEVETESRVDEDLSRLLSRTTVGDSTVDSTEPFDSIMDDGSSEDQDADEVATSLLL